MELGCAATVRGKRLTALDSSASSVILGERQISCPSGEGDPKWPAKTRC